jgi:tetratricopeptide (TPR) repeat protein
MPGAPLDLAGPVAPPSPPPPPPTEAELRAMAERVIVSGHRLRALGQFVEARAQYTEALQIAPDTALLHFLIGACDWAAGQRDAARLSLETAVRLDPRMAAAHEALGQWFLQEGMTDRAMESTRKALELSPHDDSVAASLAFVLEASGDLDEAWELTRRLIVDRGYAPPLLAGLYGRMAGPRGQAEPALEVVTRVLQEKQSTPDMPPRVEAAVRHAAAGLLDRLGRYDEAFFHTQRANLLRKPRYDPATTQRDVDRLIAYFTAQRVRCLPRATYRSDRPVLVVGMPRSGTSLVEQILASHPQAFGAGELDFVNRIFYGTLDMLSAPVGEYPECLDTLTVAEADGMAQIYLEPLASFNTSAARIIDKMPLNFLQLGLVALLLPDARVIHCRRDPLDTCLSCFMTDFINGHLYKYDLGHCGHFYRQYERLMAHWKSVLELRILDVQYEDVVADPEGQARRMVEFIGLPWDQRCLRFHETKRPVATASGQQVKVPIYKRSVGRWRNYEKHLAPLRTALGDVDPARG